MSRYSEQQRAEIEEAVQALIGEMDDVVHHQVADSRWYPSSREAKDLTDGEFRQAAEQLARRMGRAVGRVWVTAAAEGENIEEGDR
ncbi:hypothetical protein ACFWZ2_35570 [Streptomyces sp. NPDC059002]|uniref:hypothetical protein n=1 Tax=Streptomyces sp. NPDC059002 TaxID=3346690 RepID=UPI0036A89204